MHLHSGNTLDYNSELKSDSFFFLRQTTSNESHWKTKGSWLTNEKTAHLSSLSKCFCCRLHLSFPPPPLGRLFVKTAAQTTQCNTAASGEPWSLLDSSHCSQERGNNRPLTCTAVLGFLYCSSKLEMSVFWRYKHAYSLFVFIGLCSVAGMWHSADIHIGVPTCFPFQNVIIFSRYFLSAFEGLTGFHIS